MMANAQVTGSTKEGGFGMIGYGYEEVKEAQNYFMDRDKLKQTEGAWEKHMIDQMKSVNNPKHYTSHPSGVECVEVTEHMTFNLGNVVKYLWRNGLKDGNSNIQDLRKALWYLNREIERLEKSET